MSDEPRCRLCGGSGLWPFLSLGDVPLANAFLTEEELEAPEPRYPLTLAHCPDCTLVQLEETVPPESLFRDYLYLSSVSRTMLRHARDTTDRLVDELGLGEDTLVVELGSNDGYMLQYFHQRGVPVLGIDPAENLNELAAARGIDTITAFFDEELARGLRERGHAASLMIANNVLAHVPRMHGFVAGVRELLAPGGVAMIEVPWLKCMIDRREYDTIYHEHVSYFSLTALERLLERHRLSIDDVEVLEIHGGSLRVFARREEDSDPSGRVSELLREEADWVEDPAHYRGFKEGFDSLKETLDAFFTRLKARPATIAAYGAAAKGTIFTNLFEIDRRFLDFVVDRNTYKQGRFLPGTHLPIHGPERLLAERPDFCLLLVWNLADEIVRQERDYLEQGGRFVVPVPRPRIL